MATTPLCFDFFPGVVLMSSRVNFHVVGSALIALFCLQNLICLQKRVLLALTLLLSISRYFMFGGSLGVLPPVFSNITLRDPLYVCFRKAPDDVGSASL